MQTTFFITKEKERELLAFIENKCDCRFLRQWSQSKNVQVDLVDEILDGESLAYLILSRSVNLTLKPEKMIDEETGSETYVIPLYVEAKSVWELPHTVPIIQYECGLYDGLEPNSEQYSSRRIYANTIGVLYEYKSDLRKLFSKIKSWIQKNATKTVNDEGFVYYYVG